LFWSSLSSLLGSDGLGAKVLKVKGVGALNGHSQGAGPNLSGHDTEGTGDTEEDGVVVVLGKSVVHKEGSGSAINIGPGVLNFTSGSEEVGDGLVVGAHEVDEVVVLDVLLGELKLEHEAGVSLAEDGVTVAGDDLTGGKGVGNVGLDVVLGPVLAELFLEGKDEGKAFLVGESVEGTSETVHTSGEGEVGVGEGRADEVGSVSGDIATFVITIGKVSKQQKIEV
jgi:hypothetical protein